MRFIRLIVFSFFILFLSTYLAQRNNNYQYVSPKPSSIMVSSKTNIILKCAKRVEHESLSEGLIIIEGEKSGIHSGQLILSDDNKTIIFNPDTPFSENEKVTVNVLSGIKTETGELLDEYSFTFTTAGKNTLSAQRSLYSELEDLGINQNKSVLTKAKSNELLPPPTITIDSVDNPSGGYIFLAAWDRNVPAKYGNYIFILDKMGHIVDSVRVNGAPFDLQIQPNGYLTYALGDFSRNAPLPGEDLRHIVMDENLTVVDSFKMKNGYTADFHEFKLLPNGHAVLMSYHSITYDMSTIVEGGKTDANLVINIIQEQDKDKNVVFEWRNIDYIPITDTDLPLTDSRINYGTLNGFDIDTDGNILGSFRNHSQIMKISRETGEVLWRMGGKNGEFTYVGEHEENAPFYHARQHNVQRIKNGNIIMFDNGQFHKPPYSRAVEYEIDEINKVATLVDEWRYPNGNIFCMTAGNAQRLDNGGWFIGYGVPNPQFVKRNAVETHADGSIALEISLPEGVLAYRVSKLPWKENVEQPTFTNFEVKEGNTYSFNNETITTGVNIKYIELNSPDYNEAKITKIPYAPINPEFTNKIIKTYSASIVYEVFAINSQTAEITIDLNHYPEINDPANTIVYYRLYPNSGLFIPKNTIYNLETKTLTATIDGGGEIVFCVHKESPMSNTPILFEPENKLDFILQDSIALKWSGKGYYDTFTIQISKDSSFNSILREVSTNSSYISVYDLEKYTTYYWRVNSQFDGEISTWSDIWSFNVTDPSIEALSPTDGDEWEKGSLKVIRWKTNILDYVIIDLLKDETPLLSIDTIKGSLQAYAWELPLDIDAGDSYQIKITSETDSGLFDLTENTFSIIDTVTNVNGDNQIVSEYKLMQNYPNPFNPTTIISYNLAKTSFVTLKVFDLLGAEVATLVKAEQAAGKYNINFDASKLVSGIYIYQINAGEFIDAKKMILLR